jgi:molybdenum cofactor guanylyltransferase
MLAGIFVGGASRRMGTPKGLLVPPTGETSIVERWAALLSEVAVPWVLVGRRVEYTHLGGSIADDPPGNGPIGGLHALVHRAKSGRVLALACDMPFVGLALLKRLIEEPADTAILAPQRDGRWEPLFARYDVTTMMVTLPARIARKELALQGLLDAHAAQLITTPLEDSMLRDWDEPSDIEGP